MKKDFNTKVEIICSGIANMLKQKNKSYGNSALDPVRVFSKSSIQEQLFVRIDDKLSRIKRGNNSFNEDTVKDLIGYLVILLISEGKK
jgi:ubiquinone biosynthesis protein Coq4